MHSVTNGFLTGFSLGVLQRNVAHWARRVVGVGLTLCAMAAQAQTGQMGQGGGGLPMRNLLVEVRQVDEGQSNVQGGGIERGAVVISSDGRVSGGAEAGWVASTRQRNDSIAQQVRVLNGHRASMRLGQSVPLQWWQASVTPQGVQAVPTTVFSEAGKGFTVRPSWPGGRAPVTVEVQTELGRVRDPNLTIGGDPDNGVASENFTTLTTLRFPLGEWVTIASSGQDGASSQRGVVSTRDVERSRQIVVQMRVTAQ